MIFPQSRKIPQNNTLYLNNIQKYFINGTRQLRRRRQLNLSCRHRRLLSRSASLRPLINWNGYKISKRFTGFMSLHLSAVNEISILELKFAFNIKLTEKWNEINQISGESIFYRYWPIFNYDVLSTGACIEIVRPGTNTLMGLLMPCICKYFIWNRPLMRPSSA